MELLGPLLLQLLKQSLMLGQHSLHDLHIVYDSRLAELSLNFSQAGFKGNKVGACSQHFFNNKMIWIAMILLSKIGDTYIAPEHDFALIRLFNACKGTKQRR